MINKMLVSTAVVDLIAAGIVLAKGHKKEHKVEKEVIIKEHNFTTKYDEITYYYNSGVLSEEEYKNQIKNIIN